MALGMELEMRLAVTTPEGDVITQGDTKLLEHDYFTLVTDKFRGYSNLELVMKHFDQFRTDASQAFERRLQAMQALVTALYKGAGKPLKTIIQELDNRKEYSFQKVSYIEITEQKDKRIEKKVAFSSEDAIVQLAKKDDQQLYIHYTIGFEPKNWLQVVKDVAEATRSDTENARPKTHAEHAIAWTESMTKTLPTNNMSREDKQIMQGHLALLYMQMMVFVERTAELGLPELEQQKEDNAEEITAKKEAIEDFWEELGLEEGDDLSSTQRKSLREHKEALERLREERTKLKKKIKAITDARPFGSGQPKNKIAALPRASLADTFKILPTTVQTLLSRNKNREMVIDGLAENLEENFGLDFTEGFRLESSEKGSATLLEYVQSGLGKGKAISQQVVFGGMNEVGIDRTTNTKVLLPMEFRSILRARVSWDRLNKTDAPKVLAWAQDPATNNL